MKTARFMLIAALAIATAAIPSSAANDKNAILFSWDGVQREHLKECLSKNELPNLAALIKEGKLVDIQVTHVTDTKAGHSQMLTGYDPEVTGVFSNGKFKPIPVGYTIFERLESALGKDKIATVMLTGKTHHIGNCPPKVAIDPKTLDPGDAKPADAAVTAPKSGETPAVTAPVTPAAATPRNPLRAQRRAANQAAAKKKAQNAAGQNKLGEPWYLVYKNMDVWDGEKARHAPEVGPLALGYLDKYSKDRFFMFFHFSDPDSQGHKFGENSKQENDSYILCDEWLGKVVTKLKDLKIYDKTLIYVNSDHGFDEGGKGHKNAPTVFLATNDKQVTRDGNQRDIVPTILAEMGVDSSKFEPKLTGKSLTEK
ncbi:MAG: alkaline phosphatase family protein [Armatimonadetes bacterium]|nr:alkaline phosphatase family protein [Armatimonadota bacterium]